jgi:hypothetical protein
MKTIAALLVVGVLALASAGTSGARGGAKPPFGVPDPARLVLRSADLGNARVIGQGYYSDKGFASSYAREFGRPVVSGIVLLRLESDAEVAANSADARSYVAAFRHVAGTPLGRAAITKALTGLDVPGVVVSHVRVAAPKPLPGTNGSDVVVSFRLLDLPAQAHLAVFSADRFLGELMTIGLGARPGRTAVARLAAIMTRRFRAAQPPTNLTKPSISGTAAVGQALTATPGTWSTGPIRYAYQWGRCDVQNTSCNDIPNATGSTYVPTLSDAGFTLRVWVRATNANGTRNALSDPTAPVVSAPVNTALPVISGSPVAGQLLTASPGTWAGSPDSYLFEWKRCDSTGACVTVGGNDSTFALQPVDVDSRIVVTVTARNAAGEAKATSIPTAVVTAPASTT